MFDDYAPYAHVATAVFGFAIGSDGVPRYDYLNPAAINATGWSLDDIRGKTALSMHPGLGGELVYRRQLKAIETGEETTYVLDLSMDGQTRVIRTVLIPVKTAQGDVIGLIGTALEENRQPDLETQTPGWGTGLSEIEQFVAMAAHDLRTPMRNVQIIAGMLREGAEGSEPVNVELLDLLDSVAQQSSELICDVLDHAQSGLVAPERLPFDFGLLCQTIQQVLDPTRVHRITWTGAAIQTDKTAVQIVLRNLIDNALKHGKRDRIEVDVSARNVSDGMVEISVHDNGVGFDNPGQMFLDTGKFRSGSGYGLLGIRRLINTRGGTIKVDSAPKGAGCTIRFTLPGTLALMEIARSARA